MEVSSVFPFYIIPLILNKDHFDFCLWKNIVGQNDGKMEVRHDFFPSVTSANTVRSEKRNFITFVKECPL